MAGLPRLAGRTGVRGRLRPLRETGRASCSRRRGRGEQSLSRRRGYPAPRADVGRAVPCRAVLGGLEGHPPAGAVAGNVRSACPGESAGCACDPRPFTLRRASRGQGLFCRGYFGGPFLFPCFLRFFLPSCPVQWPRRSWSLPPGVISHGFVVDPSRRPPMTCPPGCNFVLHRGSCPHTRQRLVGAQREYDGATWAGGTGTREQLDTALNRGVSLSGPWEPSERGTDSPNPPAFGSAAPVSSKSIHSWGKQGGNWMRTGGAAQRPRHWPPRVNCSLPFSASSGWRVWCRNFNDLGCWGRRVFSEGGQGK